MTDPDPFDLLFAVLVPEFVRLTPQQVEEAKRVARLEASSITAEADLTGRPLDDVAAEHLLAHLAAFLPHQVDTTPPTSSSAAPPANASDR